MPLLFAFLMSITPGKSNDIWIHLGNFKDMKLLRYKEAKFKFDAASGGSLKNTLIVSSDAEIEGFKLLWGPFKNTQEAFMNGLSLLKARTLDDFYICRTDGTPLALKVTGSSRNQLTIFAKAQGYPQIGISLFADVPAYFYPSFTIPPLKTSPFSFSYRDEMWIIREQELCESGSCRRWFNIVTPPPYRLLWVAGGMIAPVSEIKSIKDSTGKILKYSTAAWYIKNRGEWKYYAILFNPGSSPKRYFFDLKRLFYLKPILEEDKLHFVDSRGTKLFSPGKIPSWQPVKSHYSSSQRKQFFTAPRLKTDEKE